MEFQFSVNGNSFFKVESIFMIYAQLINTILNLAVKIETLLQSFPLV